VAMAQGTLVSLNSRWWNCIAGEANRLDESDG